ncbi:hypothetical protein HKD37_18G050579 [Glycine soja]
MSDGWTDKKRRSIYNFLVNNPKGTIFLYSLDTSEISKIVDKVLKMLDDVVNFVEEENVVQVITDNAANYKAKRKHLNWTPCAAHCIDLIFEDFEKHLKTMLISIMKKFTYGRDLIRPGMTRFATTYLTLACLHELQASLMSIVENKQVWNFTRGEKSTKCGFGYSRFWKNVTMCLKVVALLMVVLRLVDSDVKPSMGFIYEEMEYAKEKIKCNFDNIKKIYEPIWKIIDERWDHQLHRPLHVATYYLNLHLHYEPTFKHDDPQVKEGLYMCMRRLVKDVAERKKTNLQLVEFHFAKGLFSMEEANDSRKVMQPGEWWEMFNDGTPKLRRFVIYVMSLTCSSSGCEHNRSSFEMVHTKRRNRLHQQKMNDLVYVMYNLKLKRKQNRKRYNDEDEQPQDEGDGGNVELVGDVGGSSNDLVVNTLDLDNLILGEPNDDAQSEKDIDDDREMLMKVMIFMEMILLNNWT